MNESLIQSAAVIAVLVAVSAEFFYRKPNETPDNRANRRLVSGASGLVAIGLFFLGGGNPVILAFAGVFSLSQIAVAFAEKMAR